MCKSGLLKLFCSEAHFENGFSMRPPSWIPYKDLDVKSQEAFLSITKSYKCTQSSKVTVQEQNNYVLETAR